MAKKKVNNKKSEVKKAPVPDKKLETEKRKKLREQNKLEIFNHMKANKTKFFRHRDFIDVIGKGGVYARPLLVELMKEGKAEKKTEKNRVNYYKFKSN